jgi:cell division protein FtsN
MKKTIQFILILAIVVLTGTACKSKQKVAKITGANIPAASTTTATSTNPTVSTPDLNNQNEVTRNEKFILADGETNADALKFKYHVVVGSFKSQTNAKGLQTTLKSEGNKSIVVVNEQGMFRVLIASFNEYAEARARINQIKDRFADSWVLVQK